MSMRQHDWVGADELSGRVRGSRKGRHEKSKSHRPQGVARRRSHDDRKPLGGRGGDEARVVGRERPKIARALAQPERAREVDGVEAAEGVPLRELSGRGGELDRRAACAQTRILSACSTSEKAPFLMLSAFLRALETALRM
jgi:hypothetical protein